MTRTAILTAAVFLYLIPNVGASDRKQPYDDEWYFSHYLFLNKPSRPYTFESELIWPEGYKRLDSAKLTDFQFWVSHVPLWHRGYPVNAGIKGQIYAADEVCRPLQFQWRIIRLADYSVPLQLDAEYYLYKKRFMDWSFLLKNGERMGYSEWLKGRLIFRPKEGYSIEPGQERKSSEFEENKLLDLCSRATTYASLAANCDSIRAEDLLPGDLIIGHNERGLTGQVWIVLNVIENRKGNRLYCLSTGCADQCAPYIPKFNADRDNPWITLDRIRDLTADYSFHGYFRLPIAID